MKLNIIFIIFLTLLFAGCGINTPDGFYINDELDINSLLKKNNQDINKNNLNLIGDYQTNFISINNDIYYIAEDDNYSYIIKNNNIFERSNISNKFYNLMEIDNKIAYQFSNKYIFYDGKKYGSEYDSVNMIYNYNNKFGYLASKDYKFHIIFNGNDYPINATNLGYSVMINDKLAYIDWISRSSGGQNSIIYNNKIIVTYDGDNAVIVGLYNIENKLGYVIATKNNEYKLILEK